jgi:uncharacterized protein (TIGR01777 family)
VRFVISGASGLIGRAVTAGLVDDGHEVIWLVRQAGGGPRRPGGGPRGPGGGSRRPGEGQVKEVAWNPDRGEVDVDGLEGCRVFVNLSGAPIGDRRLRERRKDEVVRSRLQPTALLATAAAKLAPGEGVLVSASAVGWYGDRGDEVLDEQSAPGSGFLAELCRRWEEATAPAGHAGVRVVHLRSGVVIAREGGALKKQLPLFRLGLGARLGTGRQWVSWISLDDEVGAIRRAAADPELVGAVNAVSPQPVTNLELTRAIALAVHRPALLSIPSPVLRTVFGPGVADELLLASQRVHPARLSSAGYLFKTPDIQSALTATLKQGI